MAVVPRQNAPSKKMIWQYWIDNGIQRGCGGTINSGSFGVVWKTAQALSDAG